MRREGLMKKNKKMTAACDRIFRFFDYLPDDGETHNHPYHSDYDFLGDMPISTLLNAQNPLRSNEI